MKEIVTQLGANATGLKLMDQVFEFERELAKVRKQGENLYIADIEAEAEKEVGAVATPSPFFSWT